MKIIFTETYSELKEKLSELDGEWDESQANKKVFRHNGGIMNWYESTGTIQFQGREDGKAFLEAKVKFLLYPNEYPTEESDIPEPTNNNNNNNNDDDDDDDDDTEVADLDDASVHNISHQYLNGEFADSEIVIEIVSAVGTEVTRVITPLKDRLSRFGYKVEEIKVSSLLSGVSTTDEYERIKQLMDKGDHLRKSTENNQ